MRDGRTQPRVESRVEKLEISLITKFRLTPMICGKNDLGVMSAHIQIVQVRGTVIRAPIPSHPVDKVELGRGGPLGRFETARGVF